MSYPPAAQVNAFYDESERLVRFLVASDRGKFLELFELSARGSDFEIALTRAFGGTFRDLPDLEEQFHTYAVKESAVSSLQ
ncbi:MAG TPA: hypothetical protein VF551_00965, partial [Chthoniobacterales bacterium]